jgi:glycosyltransferase involved in cell wall biosynthesis
MYSMADIIIDQLMMGSHGAFACEAMALGKPVICYILDELLSTYPPGFPIINANPGTIVEVLEEIICSPEKRYEIGKKSRKYAEEVHDIRVVAKKLLAIYNAAMV